MLPGTSSSRCPLPFCSAGNPGTSAAEILQGKRAGRSPACEGAGLLLPLHKSGKAGVGCETTLLKQARSVLPRGCERESVLPSQSCPSDSAGPVSCTALPAESCSVTLARQPAGTELPHAAVHLSFSVLAAGSERDWLSLFPALSLMGGSLPSANRWISAQASSRYWDERIHRKNKPRREGAVCYFSRAVALSREGKAEQLPLTQPSSELKMSSESAGRSLPCQSWMLCGSTEGQMTSVLCE